MEWLADALSLWYVAGSLMLGVVVVLMALGIPVAFAFLIANVVGAMVYMGGVAGIEQMINNGTRSISNFLLIPVPLFILMGELFFHCSQARRQRFIRPLPTTSASGRHLPRTRSRRR